MTRQGMSMKNLSEISRFINSESYSAVEQVLPNFLIIPICVIAFNLFIIFFMSVYLFKVASIAFQLFEESKFSNFEFLGEIHNQNQKICLVTKPKFSLSA